MELVAPELGLLIWTLFTPAHLILSIVALIQIARTDFKDVIGKLIWVLMVLLLPIAGAVLYFFIGKKAHVNIN